MAVNGKDWSAIKAVSGRDPSLSRAKRNCCLENNPTTPARSDQTNLAVACYTFTANMTTEKKEKMEGESPLHRELGFVC